MFADRLPAVAAYADLLATVGVERGLIGPREVPRLWERHLGNCGVVADLAPHAATVCDVGSGAGLPGLVLALCRPDLRVTLVEPLLRRTRFLDEAVAALGLGNVEVVRARAEALHGTREFMVVTSRAVAPLVRLLGWSLPLVAPSGRLLALKGSSAAEELAAAAAELERFGCTRARVVQCGGEVLDPPTTVIEVEGCRRTGLGSVPRAGGPAASAGRAGAGGVRAAASRSCEVASPAYRARA